jgi:hypothetical protein
MTFINPGSGPVSGASEQQAKDNMTAFAADLEKSGVGVISFVRAATSDYGDGRYAFEIATADGLRFEIQMPGGPLDRVKEWSRLYIDGQSWEWDFALRRCRAED